jgi:prepilin signal peptidase PulO-like enzyme (type II secretory pathway)
MVKGEFDQSVRIPFGPFLALGTLVTWFGTALA